MDMADRQHHRTARAGANRPLQILAGIAGVFLLYWGEPFFVPLLVALLIALALSPLVDVVTRVLRYRVLAAALVVLTLLGAIGAAAWTWSDEAMSAWNQVPDAARRITHSVQRMARQPSSNAPITAPITEVKKAAAEIETATGTSTPAQAAQPAPSASPSIWQLIGAAGKGLMIAASQLVVVVFLVFFMLASGNLFKRKIVVLSGERLTQRKLTVEVLDEIDLQVRRYLLVLMVSNILVGVGTGLVFHFAGLENAGLWGLVAGVLHTIPYFGSALIAVASLIVAFVQFDDWGRAAIVALSSVVVATIVGNLFSTWLASRQTRMNTTATFVGLLFFAWIWGFWGLLLGIPLLAIVKTICEHHEEWKPVAELLGQ
jgi:predicted PurR-regulated permease PerM